MHLSDREIDNYYGGFANQVLWPLCHIFPNRCEFDPAYWGAYRRVNERFAKTVCELVEPGDTVWVNDFHLCLVPGYLRAACAPVRIGLFWHIPFPPPEVFGICQWREELLSGLLGADVIGLQTDDDARNFASCVTRFLELPAAARIPCGCSCRIARCASSATASASTRSPSRHRHAIRRWQRGRRACATASPPRWC